MSFGNVGKSTVGTDGITNRGSGGNPLQPVDPRIAIQAISSAEGAQEILPFPLRFKLVDY